MFIQRFAVSLATDGSGNFTGYTPVLNGRIVGVVYAKDGSNPLSNGGTLTVSAEATAEAILTVANLNASASYYPRSPVHASSNGGVLTFDGTWPLADPVRVAQDRVKVALAGAGANKVGVVYVIVE
jgi:hypothetical protein